MKTTSLTLLLLASFFIGCDSAVEPPSSQLAGTGASFMFNQTEFDPAGSITGSGSTTLKIDSANITIESRSDVMRITSPSDTLHFIRDGRNSFLIWRPEIMLFDGISIPKRWQPVLREYDTAIVELGLYTGNTTINGMAAVVTIRDREQYLGTTTLTVGGKALEVITKSFTVEVEVVIPQFNVTVTTTVSDIYGFAPELGFLATISQIRSSDSQFSPIIPGRTELTLTSYTLN
jgi:hypothetical protein